MKSIYITLTGTRYHYGKEFLEPGMKLKLIKEPDNEYDHEAIRVELKGVGHLGYVANSVYTVLEECMSSGRLYDRIGDTAKAKVVHVLPQGVVCKVSKKSLIANMIQESAAEEKPEQNEV